MQFTTAVLSVLAVAVGNANAACNVGGTELGDTATVLAQSKLACRNKLSGVYTSGGQNFKKLCSTVNDVAITYKITNVQSSGESYTSEAECNTGMTALINSCPTFGGVNDDGDFAFSVTTSGAC